MKTREYTTYEDYLAHQSSKLDKQFPLIQKFDRRCETIFYKRFSELSLSFAGKSIICLGARLGGEVRAFKSLGALAIGIDLNPHDKNLHVLHGDFHSIQFPDESFDYVFSNCFDHVLYIDAFFNEILRVLKRDGIFIMETGIQKSGKYEVRDTDNFDEIKRIILDHFVIIREFDIKDPWVGKGLLLKKI